MSRGTLTSKSVILITSLFLLLGFGSFGQNKSDIQGVSKAFIESIVKGNKDACLDLMTIENAEQKDSVMRKLDELQYRVMNEFGRDPQVKPLGYNEPLFLFGLDNIRNPNAYSKVSFIQIEYHTRFSVFQLAFNEGNKIVSFGMLNEIYIKPNSKLWFVGIPVMLLVLTFNIYVIVKVYKSDVTRKWVKYLMVIFLNLPVLGYNALSGVTFQLLGLNLFGVSFGFGNYFTTYWSIGVPIGAIIVLWRIKSNLYRTKGDDWIYHVTPSASSDV